MTHNIPTELQRYVQERIIPQYAGFDKAHQIDHAEKVIEESLKLALHYEVDSAEGLSGCRGTCRTHGKHLYRVEGYFAGSVG